MTAWFVTGTDTGVGKSLVAAALMHRLRERFARVAGMKPVAAGSHQLADGRWTNDDVLALRDAATVDAPLPLINPFLLHAAVSPHIAAQRDGVTIELQHIVDALAELRARSDAVVVEGAGGLLVPLGNSLDGGDLAQALGLPIVLVVGLRLGCLNHALLTAEAIASRGLRLAGWIANRIDPQMPEQQANIDLLAHRLGAPCIGDLPFASPANARAAAAHLQLDDAFFQGPTP